MHAKGQVTEARDGATVRLARYCMDVTDQRDTEDRRNRALADLESQQQVLEHHRLPADRLVLKLTESAVMERMESARAVLGGEIADLGVRLVIDDFGTGCSSIARLRQLPVVGIKIDQRFTGAVGASADDDEVVSAIADLGHALDLQVLRGHRVERGPAADRGAGLRPGPGLPPLPPIPADALAAVLAVPPPG